MNRHSRRRLGSISRAFHEMSGKPDGTYYLYLIGTVFNGQFSAPVKVGITKDVQARLRNIQTSCPNELDVVHAFAVPNFTMARALERAFHQVKAGSRTYGEWFDLSPRSALLSLIINFRASMDVAGADQDLIDEVAERSGFGSVAMEIAATLIGDENGALN